jgi:hypothetical protein
MTAARYLPANHTFKSKASRSVLKLYYCIWNFTHAHKAGKRGNGFHTICIRDVTRVLHQMDRVIPELYRNERIPEEAYRLYVECMSGITDKALSVAIRTACSQSVSIPTLAIVNVR